MLKIFLWKMDPGYKTKAFSRKACSPDENLFTLSRTGEKGVESRHCWSQERDFGLKGFPGFILFRSMVGCRDYPRRLIPLTKSKEITHAFDANQPGAL